MLIWVSVKLVEENNFLLFIYDMKWNEKSKGLGDTIKKITHPTKIDKIVEKTTKAVGVDDCGCKGRQEKLNKIFPYTQDLRLKNFLPKK